MSAKIFQQLTPENIQKFVFNEQLAETAHIYLKYFVQLEPWQCATIQFMVKKELKAFRNIPKESIACGIIGNSMGTGKSLSAMTAALVADHYMMQETSQLMPTLIVCPRVVVRQWRNEIIKFTNLEESQVLTYTSDLSGDQRKRLVSKQNLVSNNIKFVITNYDLLRSETKKVKVPKKQSVELTNALLAECGPLFQIEWQRVIYDEAHIVRNAEKNTRGNIACTLLPAKRRWALTGTAFNNSVLDLYGVCRVLHAAPYNQKLWWKKRTGGLADTEHQKWKDEYYLAYGQEFLKLPPKTETWVTVPLKGKDLEKYIAILTESVEAYKKFCHANDPAQRFQAWNNILSKLLKLRQASQDSVLTRGPEFCQALRPLAAILADPDNDRQDHCPHCAREIQQCPLDEPYEPCFHQICTICRKNNKTACPICEALTIHERNPMLPCSARAQMVSKIINKEIELARQEQRPMKTVIFSQWTSSMNALEPVIYEKFGNDPNMNIARIDGALKNLDDRQIIIDNFNDSPKDQILVMSLAIGNVGINLAQGQSVILCDQWWNQVCESQAYSRIYRRGQTLPVRVYRMISDRAIDQGIIALKEKKMRQEIEFLDTTALYTQMNSGKGGLGYEEVHSLFSLLNKELQDLQTLQSQRAEHIQLQSNRFDHQTINCQLQMDAMQNELSSLTLQPVQQQKKQEATKKQNIFGQVSKK